MGVEVSCYGEDCFDNEKITHPFCFPVVFPAYLFLGGMKNEN